MLHAALASALGLAAIVPLPDEPDDVVGPPVESLEGPAPEDGSADTPAEPAEPSPPLDDGAAAEAFAPASQPAPTEDGLDPASAPALAVDPVATAIDPNAPRYGPEPKWWGITMGFAAATKNLGVGFRLRYLWLLQTDFGTDYLLTSLVNGLSLDDLDAFRVTASQTVGFKIRPWPFELDWRHSPRREGLIPEIILGGGGWLVGEMDHALQYFRLRDAGYFGGAALGTFLTFAFADVSLTFLYRPLGVTGYWIDGAADYTPFSLGNPILDVNVTYTLPL